MKKNKLNNNKKRTKWLWLVTIFVLLIFIVFLGCVVYKYSNVLYGVLNINRVEQVIKQDKPCEDCVRRYIDGVYVKPGQENLYPVAIIIENHVDARPQYGLSKANLVIEAEAEGRITRFLAVFADGQKIDKIGPIRSARPYFVDWAREFSAIFMHCGGSPEALVKIAKENIFDINEFYQGSYFWRDKSILAPHNIFTSTDNINKYLESKNKLEGKFLSWQFKNDGKPEEETSLSKEIIIDFQLSGYMVKWKYNKENNDYARYAVDKAHKDAEGNEIRAKNVIIQYVEAKVIDEEFRLKMEHIGDGRAVVCLDGKCEEGEWEKKSSASRTRFYSNEGKEFKFNAGKTWIEVVRPENEVNY